MSEELVKSVQDMLNEEKWTRAAISNYSKNHFIELAAVVANAQAQNCIDEIKAVSDEHLSHTKNSIIALYLSGMLGLKKKTLDMSSLVTLINIFIDNKRMNIVTYLCETILGEDESNKFALHTLADCYREENDDKVWEIYETIVKLDYEEADIAKILAEKAESEGNTEDALDYYKKALTRYVNKRSTNQVKEIWSKLVSLIPEEIDYFYMVQRKIAKNISEEKSSAMMQELYNYYKDNKRWDTAIDILKLILSIDEKDSWARREITECYRGKYAEHSQLEDYIRISNLTQGWRNVFEAIADFEKHISFDAKNFVYHRSWGVGIIRKVEGEKITINFGKKNGIHDMSLKMATNALIPLSKDHIWVLKATKQKDELVKMVKEDKLNTLKIIIKSFDNCCDFKRIKAELVPSILSVSEWTGWSTAARKLLEADSAFGVSPDDISMYTVRDRAVSQEEKLSNEFKAQKNFFAKIDILMKFTELDTESDLFADMFNYFANYLKSTSNMTEQILASFLVVRRIVQQYPHMNPGIDLGIFAQMYADIENPSKMYLLLKDTKNTSLRKDFLSCIRMLPDWADIYIQLFPTVLQEEMLTTLISSGHVEKVKKLAVTTFERYRDYREAAVYFFKESRDEDWFKETGISLEKQMVVLIHIMEIGYREIANHCDTTENRKIIRQIENLLFKNEVFIKYLLEHDTDTITKLYTLVDDIHEMEPEIKMGLRNKILEKFPDFKFTGTEEKSVTPKGLIVTSKMFNEKKAQLEHIKSVEIPKNSKEIGDAIAMGDLRENAEYKAARELQAQLNASVKRLEDEIGRAQIFDATTVTTARISFGTTATLKNLIENTTEVYTIFGPWESDPDNNVISYMSPLGNAILNAKTGEKLDFKINDTQRSYEVVSIEIAK